MHDNMVSDRRPILLTNARIVDPSRDLDISGDLLIADGVVRDARRGIGAAGVPEGTEVVDCRGKVVAPGLVDICAYIGEPGAEYRETFASASQAAAAGGVTTVICQPDTYPAIDEPAMVDFVLRRARDTAVVHVRPMAALTKSLKGEEMTEIGLLKAAGAVAFTDGSQYDPTSWSWSFGDGNTSTLQSPTHTYTTTGTRTVALTDRKSVV